MKKWAEMAIIHSIPNIKRACVIEPRSVDDDLVIKTEGVNILAMYKYENVLDLNRLHCSDVHAVVKHYGPVAASQVVEKVRGSNSLSSFVLLIFLVL